MSKIFLVTKNCRLKYVIISYVLTSNNLSFKAFSDVCCCEFSTTNYTIEIFLHIHSFISFFFLFIFFFAWKLRNLFSAIHLLWKNRRRAQRGKKFIFSKNVQDKKNEEGERRGLIFSKQKEGSVKRKLNWFLSTVKRMLLLVWFIGIY